MDMKIIQWPPPRIDHRNTENTEKNNIILCILCFSG